jgi:hypothetical protein
MDIKENLRNHLNQKVKYVFDDKKHYTEAFDIDSAMREDSLVMDLKDELENGIIDILDTFFGAHPDFQVPDEMLMEMITACGQNAISLMEPAGE